MNNLKKLNEDLYHILNEVNDDIIDAEIVDDEKDPTSDKLNKMSEGYRDAMHRQYGLIQVYKRSIDAILNKRSEQQISNTERNEIIALLKEWADLIPQYMDEDHKKIINKEEYKSYMEFCIKQRAEVESMIKDIQDARDLYKVTISKVFGKVWDEAKSVLNTKLPRSILSAIAYSNPLTALIADNFDIVSNTYKGIKNTVKGKK